jgi:hypothetical protein
MIISEILYDEIIENLKKILKTETENKILTITSYDYKSFFTSKGTWDKRRKYFDLQILINKTIDHNPISLKDLGNIMLKIDQFRQDNNNDKIYMLSEIEPNYNNLRIKLKFISYDMAAKILLNY